jgi:hypothetical protein
MILRNQARCLECDELIASFSRHHYRSCACGNLCVDGGYSYLRRCFRNPRKWKELSISIPDDAVKWRLEATKYLGVLIAFGDASPAGTSYLMRQCLYQEKEKPQFKAPKNHRQLLRWLRKLVEWDLVEELTMPRSAQCYWRSKVQLATCSND